MPDERSNRAARPIAPALVAVVLALAMTWPLVLHLGSQVGQDTYDPLYHAWQGAWIGHALLHDPLRLFQSNTYWPNRDSLAFTDMLLGYAPADLLAAQGPDSALVVHNLLFLFAYVLAFLGAYLLARELGARTVGAFAAGAAFAYAPWKLSQNGHLHVISSGGIPLALFLLIRGYRRRSARTIVAGWAVGAWQITLGFTLGLQFAYLLLILAAVVVAIWLRRGRSPVARSVLWASAAGVCLFLAVTALLARPYLRVLHEYPESKKTAGEVALYSPPPRAFLAAPTESFLWSGPTAFARNSLPAPVEQTLFPGVTVLVLALLGLASRAYRHTVRTWLASGIIVCAVLSLGLPHPTNPESGFTPYRLLFKFAPGWDGVRTPGRLNTLTSLGLALLAAAGLSLLLQYVRSLSVLRRPYARQAAVLVTAGVLVGAILVEGFGPIPHPRVPSLPPGQAAATAPQLNLPSDDARDAIYGYWSTKGFPLIVNGAGSFDPTRLVQIRQVATTFPDAGSVAFLRKLGVRTVILHPDLAFGTPWQDAAQRPVSGLPLTREDRDGVVLYHLQARGSGAQPSGS